MKAVVCEKFGAPEDLVVKDMPPPAALAPNQVRIQVHAAGLNFPDALIIENKYQIKPALPFILGMEFAGTVLETGAAVTRVAKGDRVMAVGAGGVGAFAEECIANEVMTFKAPANVPWEECAGFPVAYGTSHHALVNCAHLQKGEVLMVHGATGGVGLTAVEIGKLMGATVIATGGSDEKLKIAKQYGADYVINYTTQNIKDEVKKITRDKGADVIYDPVGGDVFDTSLRCIAFKGRLLVIGFASGRIPTPPVNLLLLKECSLVGVFWGALQQRAPDLLRSGLEELSRWHAEGKLKPHVSMTFPLAETAKAVRTLLERKQTGKIVIKVR